MKPARKSKTIWTGLGIVVFSALAVLVEVWSLLGPENMDTLEGIFGPELVGVIGIAMILLRVVTTQPLRRDPPE